MYAARAMAAHAKLIKKFHSIMTRSCLSETVAFLKEKKKKKNDESRRMSHGRWAAEPEMGQFTHSAAVAELAAPHVRPRSSQRPRRYCLSFTPTLTQRPSGFDWIR